MVKKNKIKKKKYENTQVPFCSKDCVKILKITSFNFSIALISVNYFIFTYRFH